MKIMRAPAIALLVFFALLTGCGTLPGNFNPVTFETRAVRVATDATKTVSVPKGMIWHDQTPPTRGLRFPPGTYVLEAEDADYWYLRSAAPLEFRVFEGRQMTEGRNVSGGIMIAKHFSTVPGAAYTDGEGSTKVMVWKLGKDFLNREGSVWKKTF
ncbi:MAG: hypothetical protein LBM92_01530 [Opitutaceae bacterium]|jgi:hypothetical protein|nr:hypothetical protein [Opitutaceae bacterium]